MEVGRKLVSRGRDKFRKYEMYINLLTKVYSVLPRKIQLSLLEQNRNSRGYIGQVKRYALVKNLAQHVGTNVSIKEGVYLYNIENLSIGDNVSIWPMTYIDAYGGVYIGNDVSIAHNVSLISFEHIYCERDIPIKDQGVISRSIYIEDNVWIGAKATILSGNTIQSGCVVGAGSVVTKDTEKNSVYVGIPAKKIKQR